MTLDRRNGAVNVGDGLALGGLAHEYFAVLGERHYRGGSAEAFSVCDDGGLATFEYGNNRVGCSEVNAYCT
jgi:hypothetical protein